MSPLLLLALCFSGGLLNVKWSWIFPVFGNWIPGENYFVRSGCSSDLVLAGSRFLRRFRYFHRNWPLLTSRHFPCATFQRESHASNAYFGKIRRGSGVEQATQSLRCKRKMDEKWKMGRRASRHRSITIGLRRAAREWLPMTGNRLQGRRKISKTLGWEIKKNRK